MRRRSSEIIPRPLLITLKTNRWSFKDRRNAMFMTRKGGHAPNLYAPVTSLRRMAVPIDSRGSQMLPLQAVCQASADGACTRRTDRARNILDVYKNSQHTLIKLRTCLLGWIGYQIVSGGVTCREPAVAPFAHKVRAGKATTFGRGRRAIGWRGGHLPASCPTSLVH